MQLDLQFQQQKNLNDFNANPFSLTQTTYINPATGRPWGQY